LGNYRTTIAGVLAGALPVVISYLQGTLSAKECVLGVLIAVIGWLAKDAKTGSAPPPG
jgi:hypothetical protein